MLPSNTASEVEPLLRSSLPPAEEHDASSVRSVRSANGAVPGLAGQELEDQQGAFPVPKVLATLVSFVVLGLIMSTPGVILPHLEAHYHLNDVRASLIFLVAPAGYLVGARLNAPVHTRLGRRGVAVLAPACQVMFTGTVFLFHDPHRAGFPLFLVATVVGNVGSGLLDGSWCAWAGGLGGPRTNTIQGLLHGSFSVGAGLGPFLAGTMYSVWRWPWWTWYGALLSAVVVQGLILFTAFYSEDGRRYRDGLRARQTDQLNTVAAAAAAAATTCPHQEAATGADTDKENRNSLHHPATWLCAAYFLAYVGTEAAISGWIVTFLRRARHVAPYTASLASTCFWLGMALGRLALGPCTDRAGVGRSTASYLMIAIALQAGLATVVPDRPSHRAVPVVLALIAGIGMFLGPLFPSGIVVLARALSPGEGLVGAVSFVASVGQLGAAALPFALGALATWVGDIEVFQAFIFALLVGTLGVWLLFSYHYGGRAGELVSPGLREGFPSV
ncbi:unnamed protein product [Discula destructiva]